MEVARLRPLAALKTRTLSKPRRNVSLCLPTCSAGRHGGHHSPRGSPPPGALPAHAELASIPVFNGWDNGYSYRREAQAAEEAEDRSHFFRWQAGKAAVQQLSQQLSGAQDRVVEAQRTARSMLDEMMAVEAELHQVRERSSEREGWLEREQRNREDLERKVSELERAASEASAREMDALAERRTLEVAIGELQRQLRDMQGTANEALVDKKALEERLWQAQQELAEARRDLGRQLAYEREALGREQEDWREEERLLREQISHFERVAIEAEDRERSALEQCRSLEAAIADLRQQHAVLERSAHDEKWGLEKTLRQQIADLERQASEAFAREQAAQAEIHSLQDTISGLRRQLEDAQRSAEEDRRELENSLRVQMAMLEQRAVEASEREQAAVTACQTLTATVHEIREQSERVYADSQTVHARQDVLKEQLGKLERAASEASDRERAALAECQKLEAAIAEMRQQREALESTLHQERGDLEQQLRQQLSDLERAAAETSGRERAALEKCQSLEAAVAELRQQQEAIERAGQHEKAELERQLRQQIQDLERAAAETSEREHAALSQCQSLEAAIAGLRQQQAEHDQEMAHDKEELEIQLRNQVVELERAAFETSERERSALEQCRSLEAAIADLRQQQEVEGRSLLVERQDVEFRLKQQVIELEHAVAQASARERTAVAHCQVLEAAIGELRQQQADLAEAAALEGKLKEQIRQLEHARVEASARERASQAERTALEATVQEQQQLMWRMEQVIDELVESRRELESQQLAWQQRGEEEHEAGAGLHSGGLEAWGSAADLEGQLRRQVSELARERESFMQQQESLISQVVSLQSKVEAGFHQQTQLLARFEAEAAEVKRLTVALDACQADRRVLERQLQEASQQRHSSGGGGGWAGFFGGRSSGSHSMASDERAAMESAMAELQRQLAQTQAALETAEAEKGELQEALWEQEQLLDVALIDRRDLQAKVAEQQEELERAGRAQAAELERGETLLTQMAGLENKVTATLKRFSWADV